MVYPCAAALVVADWFSPGTFDDLARVPDLVIIDPHGFLRSSTADLSR
jgi:hypothetical protein